MFLLILLAVLGDIVGMISMAALDWHSVETAVMLVTVIATVVTDDLAIGVVLGAVTAMVLFARRVAHLVPIEKVRETEVDGNGTVDIRRYEVTGQLFWASGNDLVYQLDYTGDPETVIIGHSAANLWDASSGSPGSSARGIETPPCHRPIGPSPARSSLITGSHSNVSTPA